MPSPSKRVPSYRLHKPSGQAVVTLLGKDHYLGIFDSPDSRSKYDQLIAEWLTNGRHTRRFEEDHRSPHPSVSELILAFWRYGEKHYRHIDGSPTGELENFRDALRPLRRLYGQIPATQFTPLKLRAVRDDMIRSGLCRTTINARIGRVRRVFRWAASMEMIPVGVVQALQTVTGLERGRCDARESEGVKPVIWSEVDATLPFMPHCVAAMVRLMRLSNCRAKDVVIMRGCDIRLDGDIWIYQPANHKNEWRGHERIVHLGPRAQQILRPFLKTDLQAYLFSPRRTAEEKRAKQQKTKRPTRHQKHPRKKKPKWQPGLRYTVNSLQQAVRRACRKAGIPVWTLLQVRHARATEVRERFGVEGAQASLGNRRVETAQIYAERNNVLAEQIAREIG